jgi:hypothetical protein
MYWLNVSKLAEDLREGRVEEKDRFKYYLATSILWTLGTQPFFYCGRRFNTWDLISAAVDVAIAIVGIILCYRANKSGDNNDFIGRMICLSWPITIKLAGLFVPLMLIFLALVHIGAWTMGSDFDMAKDGPVQHIFGVAWSALFGICFYRLLYKYVTLVAHAKVAENPD